MIYDPDVSCFALRVFGIPMIEVMARGLPSVADTPENRESPVRLAIWVFASNPAISHRAARLIDERDLRRERAMLSLARTTLRGRRSRKVHWSCSTRRWKPEIVTRLVKFAGLAQSAGLCATVSVEAEWSNGRGRPANAQRARIDHPLGPPNLIGHSSMRHAFE